MNVVSTRKHMRRSQSSNTKKQTKVTHVKMQKFCLVKETFGVSVRCFKRFKIQKNFDLIFLKETCQLQNKKKTWRIFYVFIYIKLLLRLMERKKNVNKLSVTKLYMPTHWWHGKSESIYVVSKRIFGLVFKAKFFRYVV